MSLDKQVLSHLRKSDKVLAEIIDLLPPPSTKPTGFIFHDLMSCILEQQIHYRSTKRIFQKMLATAELEILTPDNFWVLEEKAFNKVKLSAHKYQSILDVLAFFRGQKTDWSIMEDQEIRKRLTPIKGISNWTVDMILLYTLKRPNILPVDDYHFKQIITKLYTINPNNSLKKEMIAIAEPWEPYRSLAVKYLFAWKKYRP